MSDPYDLPPASNTIATVSAGLGVAALLGTGCCCVPLVNYLAYLAVPVLALAAVVTGIVGMSQANTSGVGKSQAMVGIGAGAGSIVVGIGMVVVSAILYGGLSAVLSNM